MLGDVEDQSVVNSCEDLEEIHCQGVKMLEKPKKHDFWCDFHCLGFILFVWASGDMGECFGGDEDVYLAVFGRLGVKKLNWGGIFAFLMIFVAYVAHKRFRESRKKLPGVVESERIVPVATAVWGKNQTLRRSHYFVGQLTNKWRQL